MRTPSPVQSHEQAGDFDPENVLAIRNLLGVDYWYLFSEEWAGEIVSKLHPGVSQQWDELQEAYEQFLSYPGLDSDDEDGSALDSTALMAFFPPSSRPELEDRVARVVDAFRSYRDALGAAVQRRLTMTAVSPDSVLPDDHSAIAEGFQRLGADRENLSDAVASFCGPHGSNHPEIAVSWSEAERAYLNYLRGLEPGFPRLAPQDGPSGEPAPLTDHPPAETAVSPSGFNSLCEQFQSVRAALLSAVEAGIALSVYDYDPDWASPGSSVVIGSVPPTATNPER